LSIFDKKLKNQFLISVTEKRSKSEIDEYIDTLSTIL